MSTLDKALDCAMELDFEAREMLIDILRKRQIEQGRERLAREAEETMAEYHTGMYKSMTAKEGIAELHKLLNNGLKDE